MEKTCSEVLQVLSKMNIDSSVRDRHHRTPLMMFCGRKDLTPEEERYEQVKNIMEDLGVYAMINATDLDGNTALHYCAKSHLNPIVFSVLLHYQPDTIMRNRSGHTALDLALKNHNIQV